jgi:hypothetical protein
MEIEQPKISLDINNLSYAKAKFQNRW